MSKKINLATQQIRNTPALRFPKFKDEWVKKKLGDLLEFKNGINASKEQYGSGYKFINVLDILNNDYITHDKIIGSVNVDELTVNKFPVSYGDILFQRSSETREEVGTASVYLDKNSIATFGGFVIRGKKIGEYEPVFLNKLLKTDFAREQITSKSGGSTRFNVGQEILSSVILSFPSLPEQTRIASFLTTVDKKLTQLKQKKTLLEQYKKGVMQKLFSQEIRFKNKGKEFPNWEKKKLGDVGEVKMCKRIFNEETSLTGEIPFYKIGTFGKAADAFISKELYNDYINRFSFPNKGDILISAAGTIGRTIIYNGEAGYFQDSNIVWIENNNSVISNQFLYFILQIVKYNTEGGTIQRLYNNILKSTKFNCPSHAEQTLIANFLSAIDEKLNHTETQIQQTEQYKKGLLQKMFV